MLQLWSAVTIRILFIVIRENKNKCETDNN